MNLESANAKLSRVKIRQKGNRLYLRASLPSRETRGTKQTEVPTGCPAPPSGIKAALSKAQKLESDLLLERFTWDDWTKPGDRHAHAIRSPLDRANGF